MGIHDQLDFHIDVPCLDTKVDVNDVESGAKEVLKVIKKSWDVDKVTFETCGIGHVNITLLAKQEGCDEKVVFRVFTDRFAEVTDKKRELVVTLLLNELGISPEVFCMFENGICFEFVEGKLFHWKNLDEFDNIRISKSVMREFAQLHSQRARQLATEKYKIKKTDFLSVQMAKLVEMYPDEARIDALAEGDIKNMMRETMPNRAVVAAEMDEMKKMVQAMNLPLVMCHNDANPSNFIYNYEKDKCVLVDYDATCFGFAEYDLALFLEGIALGFQPAAASSARRQPHFWKEVLLEYLQVKGKLEGVEDPEKEAAEQLDDLYVRVRKIGLLYILMYLVYAVFIATTQDKVPYLTPFHYLGMGLEMFNERYLQRKTEILELRTTK